MLFRRMKRHRTECRRDRGKRVSLIFKQSGSFPERLDINRSRQSLSRSTARSMPSSDAKNSNASAVYSSSGIVGFAAERPEQVKRLQAGALQDIGKRLAKPAGVMKPVAGVLHAVKHIHFFFA